MKFRKKPVIIDAEVYSRGMEDGYLCYKLTGEFIGFFDKNDPLPRVQQIPVIKINGIYNQISEGDYIITDEIGYKYVCPANIFNSNYEKVE